MIATWPADLPAPLRENYADSMDDLRLARRSDSGLTTRRRRVSIGIKTLNMSIAVLAQGWGVFKHFHDEVLDSGTLPFWMADPVEDGLPILLDDGTPLLTTGDLPLLATVTRLYMIGDATPGKVPHGVGYKISFTLSEIPV